MKKIFSALLIFALLLSLCACTEPPLEEPSSSVAETESQTLHFMLNELPSLAPRQENVQWEYLPGVTPNKFDPSLVYGTLIPYVGETKSYYSYDPYDEWGDNGNSSYNNSKYGFMTTDGKIICDPIFDYVNVIEDNKGKTFYNATATSMPNRDDYDSVIYNCYLIAQDGSVAVDLGENESVYDIYNDKILIGGPETSNLSLCDMKGNEIMKFDYKDNCIRDFDSGIITVGTGSDYYPDSEDSYVRFFNFDGKQILTDVVAVDGFHDGLAAAKIGDKWGVIKTDGSWLIGASYEKKINTYDKTLAAYRDGNVIIYDRSGKELAEISQSKYETDGTHYDLYDGVFGYCTQSSDGKELYYRANNTPIVCKKNKLQASAYSETSNGKGLFFATDKAGTAYVFDIDGKLFNTVEQPLTGKYNVNFDYYEEYFYTISFYRISDGAITAYIYSSATNKLLKTLKGKEYDTKTNSYDSYYAMDVDEQYFIVDHSRNQNGNESNVKILCKVSDGSDVFKGTTNVLVTKLNGKYFYSVSYKNYIAVYDNDFELIMKRLNANIY